MKRLSLNRHAKSSWKDESLRDFDRPLSQRGKRDAPDMGARLSAAGFLPDLIVTSPANRALTTAHTIAAKIGYAEKKIRTDNRIYLAEPEDLVAVIRETPDTVSHLALFGHNPGFTELANEISDARIDNIPTCGVFIADFEIAHWRDFPGKGGRLWHFDYPKSRGR